ncbi:hypothetical protein KCU73_g1088, partial [Aureobasidium melanogenum]
MAHMVLAKAVELSDADHGKLQRLLRALTTLSDRAIGVLSSERKSGSMVAWRRVQPRTALEHAWGVNEVDRLRTMKMFVEDIITSDLDHPAHNHLRLTVVCTPRQAIVAAARVASNVAHIVHPDLPSNTEPSHIRCPFVARSLPIPPSGPEDRSVHDNVLTRHSRPIAGTRQDCEREGHTQRGHGVRAFISEPNANAIHLAWTRTEQKHDSEINSDNGSNAEPAHTEAPFIVTVPPPRAHPDEI